MAIIMFLYKFYRIYILFFSAFIGALIFFRYQICKSQIRTKNITKSIVIFVLFVISAISAYSINRLPLRNDTVKLIPYCTKDQDITIKSITSSNISYYNLHFSKNRWNKNEDGYFIISNVENEDNLQTELYVPHGRERNIIFKIGPNEGKAEVSYRINGIERTEIMDFYYNSESTFSYTLNDTSAEVVLAEFLLKIIINISLVIALYLILSYFLFKVQISEKYLSRIQENRYGILTFVLLFSNFLINRPFDINEWVSGSYALNYKMGFGSRFFIGSVISLFYKDFLDKDFVYGFICFCLFFVIVLISLLINIVVNNSKQKMGIIFIVLMYLCSPGSVCAMWSQENMGRLETYNFLLILIIIVLFTKIKCVWAKYFTVIVLSAVNMAIYQGYIFLYYPVIFLICICDCLKHINEKKRWLNFIICNFLVGLAFLVFQFGTSIHFSGVEEIATYLQQHTDLPVSPDALYYEYFAPVSTAFENISKNFLLGGEAPRERTFIIICLLAPVSILSIAIWLKCRKSERFYYIIKKPFIYWGFLYVAFLPQFLLNVDWGRWMIAITFYTFFAIVYINYQGFIEMSEAISSLDSFIYRHKTLSIGVLLYLAMLNKFPARTFITETNTLWTWYMIYVLGIPH